MKEKYKLLKSYDTIFRYYFRVPIHRFINPIYGFDIVFFDDWIKSVYGNYEDGKTSLKMFVTRKFGKEGMKLLDKLNKI